MTERAVNAWARRRARRALLQALYAWQMTGAPLAELRGQFSSKRQMRGVDDEYFSACLTGVLRDVEALDQLFVAHLDRAVDALDHVERAIIRAGAFELKERLDVPARVVINEWVELAKGFGAEEGHRYVNGVLDQVAREVRRLEMEA